MALELGPLPLPQPHLRLPKLQLGLVDYCFFFWLLPLWSLLARFGGLGSSFDAFVGHAENRKDRELQVSVEFVAGLLPGNLSINGKRGAMMGVEVCF